MSYDIKLNDKQKIWVMKRALEEIKDAPLTKDEVESLLRETLHLVDFGTYDLPKNSHFAQSFLRHMPRGPMGVE